jgi:hypothetical protein
MWLIGLSEKKLKAEMRFLVSYCEGNARPNQIIILFRDVLTSNSLLPKIAAHAPTF